VDPQGYIAGKDRIRFRAHDIRAIVPDRRIAWRFGHLNALGP
jgi:hypothetical protein